MTGNRDGLAEKCEELAADMQSMPGKAKEEKSLRAQVPELEEVSKPKATKIEATRGNCGHRRGC